MSASANKSAGLILALLVGARLWHAMPPLRSLQQQLHSATLACCGRVAAAPAQRPTSDHSQEVVHLLCAPKTTSAAEAEASLPSKARLTLGLTLPINCCQASDLAWLPGVSARAAQSLIAQRDAAGPYRSAQDLRRAAHVGPKTVQKLQGRLDFRWPCWPQPAASGALPRSRVGATQRPAAWQQHAQGPPLAGSGSAYGCAWHGQAACATAASVQRAWLVPILRVLPASALSRAWGWLTRVRRPAAFANWLKQTFVQATGIDMAEAAQPLEAYACLEDLFVRELKPGARPLDADPQVVVSPTDSRVGASGIVTDGTLLQIKGHAYSLADLLGDDERARQFEGGAYVTLYLSPRDYHRIHAPASGHVVAAQLLPGRLLPVFPAALVQDGELLARNERIVTYLRSIDAGDMALVAVGATLVGRIRVAYDASLRGNAASAQPRKVQYRKPTWLGRGEELGAFELGSTVVLLCQRDKVALDAIAPGTLVRMGQRLGKASRAPRGRDAGGEPSIVVQPDEDQPQGL